MGTPYIGEIRMFAGSFNPEGWLFCNGALLNISGYEALFNLIGTTYGGNGTTNFALPDLRSRVPIHMGGTYVIGQPGGVEAVTLTTQQLPQHNHALNATNSGPSSSPLNAKPATASSTLAGTNVYGPGSGNATTLIASTLQNSGNNQPHTNIQPYLCINFIISLYGIYPTPS